MEAHYTDLRLSAAARCGCELGVPAPESAVAARNAAKAAAINLSVDLEAHSAASLAFLHEVDLSALVAMGQLPCPAGTVSDSTGHMQQDRPVTGTVSRPC